MTRPIPKKLAQTVDEWNRNVAVGARVIYRKDDGSRIETFTRSAACVLSGHTAVVWLDDVRGCVALERVLQR